MPSASLKQITSFRRIVWGFYKKHGRHALPWRNTRDPYRILVSEVMLQQTQVDRVIPYYKVFLKKFPNAKALAEAPLSDVLKTWQGLGYNRRAKMLHEAAKRIIIHGNFPKEVSEIETLPGVGPYTARAVAAFACNQDVVLIETNIRTAIIHHFFSRPVRHSETNTMIYHSISFGVPDRAILTVLQKLLPKGRAREWYAAFMDYGAHLKRSGVQLNAKSKHYTKQKKFAGSDREARGAILRALVEGSKDAKILANVLGRARTAQSRIALKELHAEGLIEKRASRYRLAR